MMDYVSDEVRKSGIDGDNFELVWERTGFFWLFRNQILVLLSFENLFLTLGDRAQDLRKNSKITTSDRKSSSISFVKNFWEYHLKLKTNVSKLCRNHDFYQTELQKIKISIKFFQNSLYRILIRNFLKNLISHISCCKEASFPSRLCFNSYFRRKFFKDQKVGSSERDTLRILNFRF